MIPFEIIVTYIVIWINNFGNHDIIRRSVVTNLLRRRNEGNAAFFKSKINLYGRNENFGFLSK